MDLVLRRRAIYTGMRPYFDNQELLDAINLWETEYSNKPKFALRLFVAQCCNSPLLKSQRSKVLGAIFKAMDLPLAQLLPDPFDEIKVNGILTQDVERQQDHKTQVFIKLFGQLLLKLNDIDKKQTRLFLIENLYQIKIDKIRLSSLRDWFALDIVFLSGSYDLVTLQRLINLSYVALCQCAGPVKADQYLAQSIKETEFLSETLNFNIYDLL